ARAGAPVPRGFVIDGAARAHLAARREELRAAVARIGGFPVAVRSRSNLEDLGGASFARLYETFLNVGSLGEPLGRREDWFRSGSAPRVRDYLAKRGLRAADVRVSVLVQRMVEARAAGVFFTLHPLSGKEEEGLIEACAGLGDRLVSGGVTPTGYRVDM